MPFARKSKPLPLPDGVTETWSAEENLVVVHLPFAADGVDASLVADELTDAVVATVQAVQAGEFGHSIPDGVTGAGARIQIETGTTPLGPLAQHNVEILTERLGKSIPLSVHTSEPAPAPVKVKTSTKKKKAAAAAIVAAADAADADASETETAADEIAPSIEAAPGLVAAPFIWDEELSGLRAEIIYLGAVDSDAQTQVDVRRLVELTIASLASPDVQALVPTDAPQGYPMWLTVVVNDDATGPLTEQMFEDGEEQFEGTRVDFVPMTEPRATVQEMLAKR